MYANAFVQTPAMELPSAEYLQAKAMKERAKKLYIRGRDIILNGLDRLHPGFLKALDNDQYSFALKGMNKEDVPLLYWAAAGWVAAYSLDSFDFALGITIKRANAMMEKALELEPDFSDGAIHEFYVQYYGALPESMGGSLTKARQQYEEALRVSRGKLASPYVSYATSVDIKTQNLDEFKSMMDKALAVNPDDVPSTRLLNIISQQKARWYLDHLDQFFIAASPSGENNDSTSQ
jgi:predicted anti-sigma-YlaC factor YlaD